jgi:glycolate oxidase FAD binding subunit
VAADVIAQKLMAVLSAEQVVPYATWSNRWQGQLKAACRGDVQTVLMVSPHSLQELSEVMKLACGNRWRVLIAGQGTKLGWGAPAKAIDLLLSTRYLNQQVEHASGDMTVTAATGVPFATLQKQLAQQKQWLPLDPIFAERATLGGILATRNAGSLRHRYGGVRDLCLGITLVRADGQVAKAGGRVVKNVAGYDLMKLLTGSFGTLGIVAELTMRTYPVPEDSATVVVRGDVANIATLAQSLQRSTLTPTVVDGVCDSEAKHLTLVVRFQSLAESVAVQIEALKQLILAPNCTVEILTAEAESQWWQQSSQDLQTHPEVAEVYCQFGLLPDQAVSEIAALQQIVAETSTLIKGRVHVGSGLGQLRLVGMPEDYGTLLCKLRSRCEHAGGYLTILEAPDAVKQQLDLWGYAGNALGAMRKLKERFDPQSILNPGRFVGGI